MDRSVDNHGARLWSTSTGHGAGLILYNGGPGCEDYLGPAAAMIDPLCQVVRFEPRGRGPSDRERRKAGGSTNGAGGCPRFRPVQTDDSFSATRRVAVPPNSMAPSRPFPSGHVP